MILAIFMVAVTSAFAEIKIINLGGASLPRESESDTAHKGQSWDAAAANWMTALRTGVNSVGTGRELALREYDLGDYHKMITSTTNRTWKGNDDSTGSTIEWGNYWHQGIQVLATDGDTFKPSDVTVQIQSFSLDSNGNYAAGSINGSVTFTELNYFRQVLDSDGTVSALQSPNVATTNFIYGGYGAALLMGGTGNVQEKLDATSDHWWNKQYKLRYTVTVHGSSEASTSWEVERQKPVLALSDGKLIITNLPTGKTAEIQFSPDLSSWEFLVYSTGTGADITIQSPHISDTNQFPKMFYRVKY